MVLQDHQSLGGQQGMGDASSLRQPEGEDLLGQEGCDGGESTRIPPWSKEELEQGEGGVKRVELAPQKNADAERRGASKHVAFAVDAALEAPSVSTLLAGLTSPRARGGSGAWGLGSGGESGEEGVFGMLSSLASPRSASRSSSPPGVGARSMALVCV